MSGLTIYCPFCGHKVGIRTSSKLSLLVTSARLYCPQCNQLQAEFVGQITNIRRAVFVDCPEANGWEKSEKELLKEAGMKPMTNEERLAQLKASGNTQGKINF
ncbi:transcriptional regulator [Rodentibacter heidelbergensis]|uniref:Transcriptional regulator n=1 Tax=Rodentibacter heidelbergensis TaxID=1908258 RepID=A0A1V3IC28_9PAST|nr:transcriptional regulator [Rodentibacter heidelbergensis]OOF37382.1 transcriptional regulator [Rodentibacter heidelbergensis]